jgi:hypothetical protein
MVVSPVLNFLISFEEQRYAALLSSSWVTSFSFQLGPERQAQLARALVEKMAIHFPGEADAAMRLRAFLRRIVESLRGGDAGGRRRERQFARIGRKCPGAVIGVGARQLVVHIHIGELVLDRLERTDEATERIARHRIVLRHHEALIRAADLFERDEDGRAVEHATRDRPTFAGLADRFGGGAIELDLCMLARRIDGIFGAARDTRAFEIDQRQCQSAFTRLVGGAGEHDGVIGIHAVNDRNLGARKLAALEARADGLWRHRAHAFGAREGPDQLAFGDLRQQPRLLFFRAGRQQRFREQINRRGERHGCQHTAQFLGHDAQLQIAEAQAAVILGDRSPQPAHFGDALPQRAVMAVLAFEHAADHLVGAFLGQELAGLVAEHFLVVGKVEIHGFRPVWSG